MDQMEHLAKSMDFIHRACGLVGETRERVNADDAREDRNPQAKRNAALKFLLGDVRRLCRVTYAPDLELADKAHAFYSALPAAEGNEFAEAWVAETMRMWSAQFRLEPRNRPAVTAAFQEVMDGMEA